MSHLSDTRKVTKFISDGTPCPTALIIEYYLNCKQDGEEIPARIDEFITTCFKNILKDVNQGLKPRYDDIFGIHFPKGRKSKRLATRLREATQIGIMLESLMNDPAENQEDGMTYESALTEVADKFGITVDAVRKMYTEYNKL